MNINVVYSGGNQNTGQEGSLGGFPSPVPVTDDKNNLFDDISSRQTTQGETDYRCLYIFNDEVSLQYNVGLYVEYLDDIGATVQLGFLQQNAIQNLNFTQVPTGGNFTITVQGLTSGIIYWSNNPNALAINIELALAEVTDCMVEVATAGQFSFNITFMGVLGNKAIGLMTLTNNNLTPAATTQVTQIQLGSPINTIAPETINGVLPTGIPFQDALAPGVVIGTLFPAEGFPVWIRRSIAPGFEPVEGDGFNLHVVATSAVTT